MSRMRYRNEKRQVRHLGEASAPRGRAAKNPGDAPIVLSQPPKLRWSIGSYPYADPALDDDGDQ